VNSISCYCPHDNGKASELELERLEERIKRGRKKKGVKG
jgi:hypothetical protein